jgi:hypothetical protein
MISSQCPYALLLDDPPWGIPDCTNKDFGDLYRGDKGYTGMASLFSRRRRMDNHAQFAKSGAAALAYVAVTCGVTMYCA